MSGIANLVLHFRLFESNRRQVVMGKFILGYMTHLQVGWYKLEN